MSRVMQAIETGFTDPLMNRLEQASRDLNIIVANIRDIDYWKYFAYIAIDSYRYENREVAYIDGLNQFLIAKKDQKEKVIYYWYDSQILKDILQYSKVISESELNECKFCVLFDDRKYGRAMKGNTRAYSLQGIENGIEYFENGWDIHYEAYYNHKFIDENNFREIF